MAPQNHLTITRLFITMGRQCQTGEHSIFCVYKNGVHKIRAIEIQKELDIITTLFYPNES